MEKTVVVNTIDKYDISLIQYQIPEVLFKDIKKDSKVVIKPNWVSQNHLSRKNEWEYVITHPDLISVVLLKVLKKLGDGGKISIVDGPETISTFSEILKHYPTAEWARFAQGKNVSFEIIDLRDFEWIENNGVIEKRIKLAGDPRGKTEVNLKRDSSEFWGHKKTVKGYYGAEYNIRETNLAHDGDNNIYKVSKTVLEADVFINLAKLKSHKKAGITCCLKNLVGINTYKNYLPHYSIGTAKKGGDQFHKDSRLNSLESILFPFIKQKILKNRIYRKIFNIFFAPSKKVFGGSKSTIRSGNWYGNDTIWRMILDLNKILFYANNEGIMKPDLPANKKKYIGIVDAIWVGEGDGPKSPDPVKIGYLICGMNPVAIDAVAARIVGFSPEKIPSIINSFNINKFKICEFGLGDIVVIIDENHFNISNIPEKCIKRIKPYFGWKGHIEY